ncbi:rotatin homolog anastral spindle 3 [Haematobia irritans]|uniref:rotatin homolog anastral spindle 3 n=1 Tax=Haematobia irritans TaxID=7368 RepID=UPI003F4F3F49
MSTLQINRETVAKLTHESTEIRLRTLDQIINKLQRALELNEKVEFKPVDLCKQLIRWFGFTPIRAPMKTLNLLKRLLLSEHYGEKVIKRMGAERLRKEFRKIKLLLEHQTQELLVLKEIMDVLKKYETCNVVESKDTTDNLEELMRATERLSVQCEKEPDDYNLQDYEMPWSTPGNSDYTSMKFLVEILKNPMSKPIELQHALQHLHLTMKDYPAEYMLQAPHIYRSLLDLFEAEHRKENAQCPIDMTALALNEFLDILRLRLEYRKKSYNYPYNPSTTSDNDLPRPCQLKVNKALSDLFDVCLYHLDLQSDQNIASPIVWEMIFKILHLFTSLKEQISYKYLHKLAGIVNQLCAKYAETDQCTRLRLYQMQLVFLLQDIARNNSLYKPLQSVEVFEPILRDYSLKCLYKERHRLLQEILCKHEKSLSEKYQFLERYENSLGDVIKMLNGSAVSGVEVILKLSSEIPLILEKLQSKQLMNILFKALQDVLPLYISNVDLRNGAIDLLIKLLSIPLMPLQMFMYEQLMTAFKRHMGCLMNGEHYISECPNPSLLAAGIIGVPLNTKMLLHILNNGFECKEEIIKSSCFKIFELLLQSQSLFGSNWSSFLPTLIPVLPLLSCCSFSKRIMDLLMKFYDPDSRHLPYVSMLQGNIAFLFHANTNRRSEALTRLLYSLNSLDSTNKYMPNLLEISDTLPNDICFLTAPREYHHVFNDIAPIRGDAVATLNSLFQLLDSPDVEPLIRKTTLMQINVLCSNWHVTGELCSAGASYLILQALENALQNTSFLDYPDTAIPAISILNKIFLYDTSLRCELSETSNIYVLLLRALMMFHNDIQVRQDATMCLFQLIFAHHLVVTEKRVEGPLIMDNIHMPLDVILRSALPYHFTDESAKLSSLFASEQEEMQYWRFVIADISCNGLENINQKSITKQLQLDIRENLKLTEQDIRLIRATQPGVSLHRLVKASTNATDHRSLKQACSMLNQQLLLPRLHHTFQVDRESNKMLSTMLNKYLQLQPSNTQDLELYGHLLDVLINCLKIPIREIAEEFIKILQKDTQHAVITMITTQKEEIPLNIFYRISHLLEYLIGNFKDVFESTLPAGESSKFYTNLFDLFMERCLQLFEVRDLQRVRCLLSLLLVLSQRHLDMSDKLLFYYCRRFLQLSLALKSFTQTGSQWHKACLTSILMLCRQMESPKVNFRLTSGVVKYISGLCAHIDGEVRVLAWSLLYLTSETIALQPETDREAKTSDCSGPDLLLNELAFLPGGFMACCISTNLDSQEILRCRQLAGQLFANLIQKGKGEIEAIEKLLEQHGFIRTAGEALNKDVCILSDELPDGLDDASNTNITTCELLTSYTRICIEISLRSPVFLDEICTCSFMFKLYEVFKHPIPASTNYVEYYDMIALICRLYSMCHVNNFIFLQRTICRDPIWLDCFCKIVFSIEPSSIEPLRIVDMIQLLMVLLKDPQALEHLTTKMLEYSSEFVKFYQYALTINRQSSMLQRCMLSLLSLLCIKAQSEIGGELSCNVLLLINGSNISKENAEALEETENENKENHNETGKKKNNGAYKKAKSSTSTISEHLCILLIRVFTHLYPLKMCKFTTSPSDTQQQIVETLSLLLKVSPNAQETASNLKLNEQLINIFKTFFEEFATSSCTTYVKRYGEHKKSVVVKNLQLLFKFLLNWHSSPTMVVQDDFMALEYSKVIIQIWPWMAHSGELKLTVLECTAFFCERSLIMCKRFSTINNSSFAHSVLHLTTKLTMADTLKIKATNSDSYSTIIIGLRLMMNCCSSVEGRIALTKAHVTDIFDSLYPFNSKATRIKPEITNAWLSFWEILSRYEEGAHAHHLNSLCAVINRCKGKTRLLCLRILRNMAFLNNNRSILLTSNDFIYTANEIISQPISEKSCNVEEQLAICVALWKLICGGVKFVAMIRGTKLSKQLRLLRDSLQSFMEENNVKVEYGKDLLKVVDTIFKIFQSS